MKRLRRRVSLFSAHLHSEFHGYIVRLICPTVFNYAAPRPHCAFRVPPPPPSPWQTLVKLFTTPEIIGYPVENQELLESDPCLAAGGPELLAK